jgi:hypothetical protein
MLNRLNRSSRSAIQAGFSLVQMSVLVTVMGLATAAAIPGGKQGQPVERQMTTEEKLDRVQKAMTGYKASTGTLPCPADARLAPTDPNFGLAAANSGTCVGGTPAASLNSLTAVVGGMIPVRTLGIEDMYAYDGYGRRTTYLVDSRATNPTSCLSLTQSIAAIQVQDAAGAVTNTYAAYISHGASGYGAYPANGAATPLLPSAAASAVLDPGKIENASVTNLGATNFDAVFVKKEKSGSFDDIVRLENSCCTGSSCNIPPYDGPEVIWGGSACDWSPPGYPTGTVNGAQTFEKINGRYKIISPRLPSMFSGVSNAFLSPDNTYLFVGGRLAGNSAVMQDWTIFKRNGKTFNLITPRLINETFSYDQYWGISRPNFTPDGKYMFAFVGGAKGLGIWQRNGDTFTLVNSTYFAPTWYIYGISWTKTTNEAILTFGGMPVGLYKYNPNASSIDNAFTFLASVPGGAISADGNYIMSGGGYNCPNAACSAVKLYKRRPGTNIFDFKDEKPARIMYQMGSSWSPDNQYFAISGSYGTVPFEVYKLVANDKLERMENFDFYPSTGSGYSAVVVDWSADGQNIASGAYDYSCSNRSGYIYKKYGDNFYFHQFFDVETNPYTGNPDSYAHTWSVDFRN